MEQERPEGLAQSLRWSRTRTDYPLPAVCGSHGGPTTSRTDDLERKRPLNKSGLDRFPRFGGRALGLIRRRPSLPDPEADRPDPSEPDRLSGSGREIDLTSSDIGTAIDNAHRRARASTDIDLRPAGERLVRDSHRTHREDSSASERVAIEPFI